MKIEVENYDQEQIDELFSTEYLDINGQIYVKKEKVFELTQKFIDKLEAEGKIKFLNAAQSEALSVGNNEQAKEDWYCPTCKVLVGGENITYDELHEACGTFLGNQSD